MLRRSGIINQLAYIHECSGILKEHTTHSIEDSLKVLECSVASLRREAANYKFSSLETFKRLNTYGIQMIKSKITLSKTSMYNENTWKHVEMRTAQIPTTWHNRIILLEYLELLATLFVSIQYYTKCTSFHSSYWLILLPFFIEWTTVYSSNSRSAFEGTCQHKEGQRRFGWIDSNVVLNFFSSPTYSPCLLTINIINFTTSITYNTRLFYK